MRYSVVVIALSVALTRGTWAQEYYSDSYQMTDQHRYSPSMWYGWGHHLAHMVRTATQGLWYVDDTGNDVYVNPAINYLRFDGTQWVLKRTLPTPQGIQQNAVTVAVGDTIFSYGMNPWTGYLSEAVCDPTTNTAVWKDTMLYAGEPGTVNYIGAAVSPNGTRVVWWTRVVDGGGPGQWVYMYNRGAGWSPLIASMVPGNGFSYVFASFLNDSVFYVGGEVPTGYAPNWLFEVGVGKVTIGSTLSEFKKLTGITASGSAAWDIWVNRANGDAHVFLYGPFGNDTYFYKAAGGAWSDTADAVGVALSCCRCIDLPDGNLYMIISQGGFKMKVIPKSSITGKIDFTGFPLIPLTAFDGFLNSSVIWPEAKEFQTTPVGGINFASPGPQTEYNGILRHTSVRLNPGDVTLRVQLPNGHETLTADQPQKIYWYTHPGSGIDTVAIDLSSDGGSTWSPVVARTPNRGSYSWKVSDVASSTCRIRVSKAATGSPTDISDANFVILYTPVVKHPPTATITRPTKDTTVKAGSMMTFEGIGADSDGYITNYVWKTDDGRVVKGVAKKFDHIYNTPGKYYATLEIQDNDTLWSVPDTVVITVTPNTGVEAESTVPNELALYPNYPNPFNAGTVITYTLNRTMQVQLAVYSVTGEEVGTLVEGIQTAGLHQIEWDARNKEGRELATGVYICRLTTPEAIRIQKVLLIR